MQENFSPQDSLRLIQSMIGRARTRLGENRIYFLLWGWVAFTGIMGQFILKVIFEYKHHYIVWLIVIPAVIVTIVYSARSRGRNTVRTYVGDNMGHLWTGMGISFGVLAFIISNLRLPNTGWVISYPFYILFYGLGTFVSGKLLQFPPLVIGGIVNWVLACVSVFFPFDYQMLFAAAAIVTSYLIPGYLLKSAKH